MQLPVLRFYALLPIDRSGLQFICSSISVTWFNIIQSLDMGLCTKDDDRQQHQLIYIVHIPDRLY